MKRVKELKSPIEKTANPTAIRRPFVHHHVQVISGNHVRLAHYVGEYWYARGGQLLHMPVAEGDYCEVV